MANPAKAPIQIKPHELEAHRASLFKFAMLQLRNEAQAEDVVQETLLAAMQGADRFAGKSSVRTWLIGILKFKIIDQIRQSSRERPSDSENEDDARNDFDALFDEDGRHVEKPSDWGNPEATLSQNQFFAVLERCMERLPKNTARVFAMREIMGFENAEICKELDISTTNCGVLLYRARMALRLCLDQRWFAGVR